MLSKTPRLSLHFSTALILCLFHGHAIAGQTTRVSVSSNEIQGNGDVDSSPNISSEGRYVVFASGASNLVAGDTNHVSDVFVYDRVKNKTERVNISTSGQQANFEADYFPPNISANGRYVTFVSEASNLVSGGTDNVQVFVHDRLTQKTELVSISSEGKQGNDFSGWYGSSLSADGRFITFISDATNLVGGDTNKSSDTFVHDRLTHKTERISVSSDGTQGNAGTVYGAPSVISEDGRYVAFQSEASNLVPGDTNKFADVFLHDRLAHKTERISISSVGKQGNGHSGWSGISLSADSRYVAFASSASNLDNSSGGYFGIYIRDRLKKKTKYFIGDNLSNRSLSADGRYLTVSDNGNYGIYDVFAKTAQKINVSSNGTKDNLGTNDVGAMPSISGDGRYISFKSSGTNLVAKDTNNTSDIFVRDRLLDTTHHADLKITPTTKPATLKLNTQGSYLYTITNNGKDVVPDVILIYLVSGGSAVNFKPSQGKCSFSPVETVCHLGQLAAVKKLTLRVTVKAQIKALSQQITVSGAPMDTKPGNNQVLVTTPIK